MFEGITPFAVLTAIVLPIALLRYAEIKKDLADAGYRARTAERLRESHRHRLYHKALGYALERADRAFGARLLSWRVVGLCQLVAMAYALAVFVVGWVAGGPGRWGTPSLWRKWRQHGGC